MAAGARRLVRRLPGVREIPHLVRPLARFVEGGARLGYAARGLVYLSVGGLGLLAALGLAPRAVGVVEALYAWGRWPPGPILLWLTGLGLYAFAGWRGLQSVFDADRLGVSPAALAARVGKAVSGMAHVAMAISVFAVLDAIEDLREVDDQAATQAVVGEILGWPGGEVLVMAAGGAILVAGFANIVRAVGSHFTEALDCDADEARWTGVLARIGYVARGVAMALAGGAAVLAGWHARSAEVRGLSGVLEGLRAQPWGAGLLGLTATGLCAFGLYCLAKARLRRIGC